MIVNVKNSLHAQVDHIIDLNFATVNLFFEGEQPIKYVIEKKTLVGVVACIYSALTF